MGSIRKVDSDRRIENEYTERFAEFSIEELVQEFNTDQRKSGWVGARGRLGAALHQAFLDTGMDCSSFISERSMSLKYPIMIKDNIIIQVKDN